MMSEASKVKSTQEDCYESSKERTQEDVSPQPTLPGSDSMEPNVQPSSNTPIGMSISQVANVTAQSLSVSDGR